LVFSTAVGCTPVSGMGSFAIPSLSALGLWRRGSKTQGGEPGAPGRRLNTVARAAAPAMARQRAGHAREPLVARAIWFPRAHPRMGRAGTDQRAALAMVRSCLWRRRHSLLHGGARAGALGRRGAGRGLRAWRRDRAKRLRRAVCIRHRPRVVDLRLSHGVGRRRISFSSSAPSSP